ncbi:MAG: hypothetical protein LIO69_07620 [Oscillospiraceae bacterium]|nr:hypothetical protein [Oscillospiraceae bacterium]
MIDGNVRDFIEKLSYEDHYVIYNKEKYFFNGCQAHLDSNGKITSYRLEVYNITNGKTVFSTSFPTINECVNNLENAHIWNGKSFWEVEKEMRWVDE